MNRKNIKRVIAGFLCAATTMAGSIQAYAAENVIDSTNGSKSADVAVTATVSSSYKVKLPMDIELSESKEMASFGPVFTSPKSTKVGVQGVLYGKYLNIAVKDVREGSNTFDKENKLTLAHATYDTEKGIYEVANENGAVTADLTMQYHKFYPSSYNVSGIEDATNIVSGGMTDAYTDYDFNVTTTSKVSADGPTLYYGKMTFFITTVDY